MPEENLAENQETPIDDLIGGGEGSAGKESKKGVIVLALAVLLAASGGVAVVMLVLSPGRVSADERVIKEELQQIANDTMAREEETAPDARILLDINDVITNIAGTVMRRFLKVNMTLELRDQETLRKAQTKAIDVRMRDRLLDLLSTKTLDDLDGIDPENRRDLKREIRLEIASILGGPETVKSLHFTEFLVQ